MTVSLLHCGKRRHPYKRTDIYSPGKKLYGDKCWLDGNDYEMISVYEFRCPGCFSARASQSVFGWVGYPYNPSEKPSQLFKIPNKHLSQWLFWMRHLEVPNNRRGVWTVQGSENQWPFRFRKKISL